jgi:hypothetical protein
LYDAVRRGTHSCPLGQSLARTKQLPSIVVGMVSGFGVLVVALVTVELVTGCFVVVARVVVRTVVGLAVLVRGVVVRAGVGFTVLVGALVVVTGALLVVGRVVVGGNVVGHP